MGKTLLGTRKRVVNEQWPLPAGRSWHRRSQHVVQSANHLKGLSAASQELPMGTKIGP